MRIDKWLWAARFYKSRSLARQAVEGGKVRVNGDRVKPSRVLRPGDRLLIHIGVYEWDVTVLALSDRRGPASEARQLYLEDEASRLRRQAQVAERRLLGSPGAQPKGRPTKKSRRMIHRFTQAEG
ncbi:MAG: RNA-binding S4 domain-containing protein [Thiobacillaceae bacterium]|nr:RNA-binding S4 domain-containing protein [Thiobacillaceae bacterium]MCX7673813.1 RNA-binding S4 domain-containing protein [Thiobacillaceae bacterium]MDW8323571.1 RNA-binding S4 domain-containing protein [Burkholderiales bacterium]